MLFFTGFARTASKLQKQIEVSLQKKIEHHEMGDICEGFKRLVDKKSSLNEFGRLLNEQWKVKRSMTSEFQIMKSIAFMKLGSNQVPLEESY